MAAVLLLFTLGTITRSRIVLLPRQEQSFLGLYIGEEVSRPQTKRKEMRVWVSQPDDVMRYEHTVLTYTRDRSHASISHKQSASVAKRIDSAATIHYQVFRKRESCQGQVVATLSPIPLFICLFVCLFLSLHIY